MSDRTDLDEAIAQFDSKPDGNSWLELIDTAYAYWHAGNLDDSEFFIIMRRCDEYYHRVEVRRRRT